MTTTDTTTSDTDKPKRLRAVLIEEEDGLAARLITGPAHARKSRTFSAITTTSGYRLAQRLPSGAWVFVGDRLATLGGQHGALPVHAPGKAAQVLAVVRREHNAGMAIAAREAKKAAADIRFAEFMRNMERERDGYSDQVAHCARAQAAYALQSAREFWQQAQATQAAQASAGPGAQP